MILTRQPRAFTFTDAASGRRRHDEAASGAAVCLWIPGGACSFFRITERDLPEAHRNPICNHIVGHDDPLSVQ